MEAGSLRILLGLVTGLAGGVLSGLFGIGGGIVLIPMTALALGLPQHQAQGLSLAAMLLPNTLPAVLAYRRQGVALLAPLCGALMAGFLGGAYAGARLASLVPGRPLRLAFVAFLLLMAWRTLRPRAAGVEARAARPPVRLQAGVGVAVGLTGGLASGLLGIGGGVVIVPLLVLLLGLGQREAQLASLVLLLPPLGLPAVWVYVGAHGLPLPFLLAVALGFQLGGVLGARASRALDGVRLQRLFGLLLLVLAGLMLAR